ncbi:hypothetical protein BT96DRAFT_840611 [Gymnopus androsaceus JB14]|uniref:Uncharacterized protein n=1 Tax=Gymnopus androsaceus JB14 TaxID=1447944 RepID=A0A6A4GIL2_9AGAR|nr:hypothetical protein BT96DRAFT_840611 [Gymnopus androsaceus JB14]
MLQPEDHCVRSGHEGHMAQFGINGGPRNARQLGWAKSYKTTLSNVQFTAHDTDVIGAAGIFWSLILSSMPTEVTEHVIKKLQQNEIPHIASRFVEPGQGFHVELGETQVIFPNASHAPPVWWCMSPDLG